MPWVIFFGLSGMFMNHPGLGPLEILGSRDGKFSKALGYTAVDPNHLADQIVALINVDRSQPFQRVAANDAAFDGAMSFQGELADGGTGMVTIRPQDGSAVIRKFPNAPQSEQPSFVKSDLSSISVFSPETLQMIAAKFLSEEGEQVTGPLTPSPKGGAELRFRITSPENRETWNVAMNLQNGSLAAQEVGAGSPGLYTALTRLHKIHNYPEQMSARWIWTLVADATGLTMVFWGLSGVVMWWQMKPTRLIGIGSLCLAGLVAAYVFSGTYSNLYWTPQQGKRPVNAAPAKAGTPSVSTPQLPQLKAVSELGRDSFTGDSSKLR